MTDEIKNGRDLADTIIESLQEIADWQAGKPTQLIVHQPGVFDVSKVRRKTGLSQAEFASTFGFNLRSLQDWESARKKPSAAALSLLKMIAIAPRRMQAIAAEAETEFSAL